MSRMDRYVKTLQDLDPYLRAGELDVCEAKAIEALRALPNSPFHLGAELNISNEPAHAAAHFDRFYTTESGRFPVKAVYTEMNGFDINTKRWYCDLFAYEVDGGLSGEEWLPYWQSDDFKDYTIKGLESLQKVYASRAFREESYKEAVYMCNLVVVTKFQRFMQRAAGEMERLCVPLYATAHGYECDFLARIVPGG